jgi:DNA-binding protein HU-beta
MRETIAKTDVKRESGHLYFIKKGDIWSAPLKKPGQPKGKQVKAASTGVEMDYSKYMYFVGTDNNGNLIVERTERQVGGSKRAKPAKKAAAPAAKKAAPAAKKAPAKKAPAKKAPAKKAPAKKSKKK